MAIIIVEGVDGSGKTTLINKLQKDLNVITIKSPRPRDYQDCKDLLARTLLLAENTNILCDRIGIISEPIYGPICRNTLGFPPKAESEQMLQCMNPIIIHCRRNLDVCRENLKNTPQMAGVEEKLDQLHHAYDEWMDQLRNSSVCVISYDYFYDDYDELLGEVKSLIDIQEPHPLDRETAMVQEFHKKFGVWGAQLALPGVMDRETFEFRKKFLFEEVQEFCDAYEAGDVVTMFDSLIDLGYVLKGSALFMGITPAQMALGFDVVHRCNMQKMRTPNGAASKRGSALDVIKPEGWQPPEPQLKRILGI